MPKKPRRKTRSAASYRAASLKGARTRRQMLEARRQREENFWIKARYAVAQHFGPTLDDMLPPARTIDLLPKVEWK